MTLHLHYRGDASVPLEVEGVTPEAVQAKPLTQIEKLPIFHGNRPAHLADFFRVSGQPEDGCIEWTGSLQGVHWIGAKMTQGEVRIEGDGGRHIGSEMSGGSIEVAGNVGDWLGGEMGGGRIRVRGNCGHLVGAAYRGSARGMIGGTILVDGDAGNEVGHTMRRGTIVIGGSTGDLAGFNMLAGTIALLGSSGIRHGAGMRRGTIAFLGKEAPPLLPSFREACRFHPGILNMLVRQLQQWEFPVDNALRKAQVDLFHGDMIEGGRGEIWVLADPTD